MRWTKQRMPLRRSERALPFQKTGELREDGVCERLGRMGKLLMDGDKRRG